MNKNMIVKGAIMGATTHSHKEHATAVAPFHSNFFESLHKEQWQEVRLGEVAEIINGYAFKSSNFSTHQKQDFLPIIKIKNVANGDVNFNDVVFHLYNEKLEKFLIKENDILVSLTGNHPHAKSQVVGQISKYRHRQFALLNQRVGKIIAKNADKNFLYFLFKTKGIHNDLASRSSGSGNQANISSNDIENLVIPLPPLNVQQQIAEILGGFDDKIDLLHRQNKTLESLALALFRHTFMDNPKNPNAPCHSRQACNCHSEPALAGEESIDIKSHRDISASPQYDKWEMGKLGDYVTIVYGKNLPTKKLLPQGYSVFGGNGKIGYFDKYLYEEPQVLLSCRGEASGKVNVSERKSFVTNNSLVLERTKDKDITFYYLKYYCLSSNFYIYVSGSAQPQITIEGLYRASFLKPDFNTINEFSKIVSDFENKIENNQKQIEALQSMRDMLLAKILNEKMEV